MSLSDEVLAGLVDGRLRELAPADASVLASLLVTAVRAVRLTPDKNVELDLVNGEIITDEEETA